MTDYYCDMVYDGKWEEGLRFMADTYVKVSSVRGGDYFKRLILYTNHKMSSLHIDDSRHVGYNIIFLVPTKRVIQILEFLLPFTASILLWVLTAEEVLL